LLLPLCRRLQFQTTTTLLTQANPSLAAGGILAPGTTVYLPP
jgi:hypothetical protein